MVSAILRFLYFAAARAFGTAVPGQVMPLTAGMIVVLVGFTGLAVDGGMLYFTKARLQHAVDAAALAGAQGLPTTADARAYACANLAYNAVVGMTAAENGLAVSGDCVGVTGWNADVELVGNDTITVTAYRRLAPTFGAVLNFVPGVVPATATVKIGSVGREDCVFPLFVETQNLPEPEEKYRPVVFSVPDGAVIDEEAPNNGSQAIREAMSDDCSYEGSVSVGDEMDVKTGSLTQFKDGWVQRRNKATAAGSDCRSPYLDDYLDDSDNLDPELTFANCPRLILVPVVPQDNYGGNDEATILGFAPFYFANVCDTTGSGPCTYSVAGFGTVSVPKHMAWGYFLNMDIVAPEYTDYNGYGTTTVVMVS